MVSWAPRLPPAVSGSGARCGRVCWARVSPVPSPSWLGCRGVFFFFSLWLFLFFSFFFFSGFVVPVPPSPFFRAGLVAHFFFFFPCPFSPWSAVTGLVLPVLGGWSPCASVGVPPPFFFSLPSRGGLAACGGVGGRFGGCGLFPCLFPFPPPFFWGGGGGLPVPPSAFPGLAHALACIQCGAAGVVGGSICGPSPWRGGPTGEVCIGGRCCDGIGPPAVSA